MPLEQEVIGLLIGGFSTVMGIATIAIVFLWLRNKRPGYIWMLLHLLILSVSFYFLIKGMAFDYTHPMASEEISLLIGLSGVSWAMGMVCLLVAVFSFSKKGA